jgi:hypothetical protein
MRRVIIELPTKLKRGGFVNITYPERIETYRIEEVRGERNQIELSPYNVQKNLRNGELK